MAIGESKTNIQFYSVKTKQKVSIPTSELKKVRYQKKTSAGTKTTYALRAEHDGQQLTKFVSKADWDSPDVPEEKAAAKKGSPETKSRKSAKKPKKK